MKTRSRKGLLILLTVAGVAVVILLWSLNTAPPEEPAQPPYSGLAQGPDHQAGAAASEDPFRSAGPPEAVIPSTGSTNLRGSDEMPAQAIADVSEGREGPSDGRRIYTMDSLPRDKSGIYWVRNADGSIEEIAVDVPGPNSPIGP